jgi:hypothetical protein
MAESNGGDSTTMVEQCLCAIVQRYEPAVWNNPRRLEALLNDLCGQHRGPITAIVNALREGVPDGLRAAGNGRTPGFVIGRLSTTLDDTYFMEDWLAEWAVNAWALALGLEAESGAAQGQEGTAAPLSSPRSSSPRWLRPLTFVADGVATVARLTAELLLYVIETILAGPVVVRHLMARVSRRRIEKDVRRTNNTIARLEVERDELEHDSRELEATAAGSVHAQKVEEELRDRIASRATAHEKLVELRATERRTSWKLPASLHTRFAGVGWPEPLAGAAALVVLSFAINYLRGVAGAAAWGAVAALIGIGAARTPGAADSRRSASESLARFQVPHHVRELSYLTLLFGGLAAIGAIGLITWRRANSLDPIALTTVASAIWWIALAVAWIAFALLVRRKPSGFRPLLGIMAIAGVIAVAGYATYNVARTEFYRYRDDRLFGGRAAAMTGGGFNTFFHLGQTVKVGWSPTAHPDRIAAYDVARRTGRGGSPLGDRVLLKRSTRSRRATVDGRRGATYCFSVRGLSHEGTASKWSRERCISIVRDDRAFRVRGRWQRAQGRGFVASTYTRTTRLGSTLALPVQTRRISLVATKCARCGRIRVTLDGTPIVELDLRAPRTTSSALLSIARFDRVRDGVLAITVVSSGRLVRVDGIGLSRVG